MSKGTRTYNAIAQEGRKGRQQNVAKMGRSSKHILKRNDLLLHRYAWYRVYHPHMSTEALNECLENEFHLCPATIYNLIVKNYDTVKKLIENKPKVKALRKMWPHINWK